MASAIYSNSLVHKHLDVRHTHSKPIIYVAQCIVNIVFIAQKFMQFDATQCAYNLSDVLPHQLPPQVLHNTYNVSRPHTDSP